MRNILLSILLLSSIAAYSQSGFSGLFYRVNDSSAYVTSQNTTSKHSQGYADIWYSTASQLFWHWNGSAYELFDNGTGKPQRLYWTTKTADYTPVIADTTVNRAFRMKHATGITFTIPTHASQPFKEGQTFVMAQDSIGPVTIAFASGVAQKGTTILTTQYIGQLVVVSKYNTTNTWVVSISDTTGTAGSGIVESVVAGTNITVDDTDPANPIVSSSGSVETAENGLTKTSNAIGMDGTLIRNTAIDGDDNNLRYFNLGQYDVHTRAGKELWLSSINGADSANLHLGPLRFDLGVNQEKSTIYGESGPGFSNAYMFVTADDELSSGVFSLVIPDGGTGRLARIGVFDASTVPDGALRIEVKEIANYASVSYKQRTVSTDVSLDYGDYSVFVNASGANRTISLPTATTNLSGLTAIGRVFVIKKTDASTNTVTIDANSSETIDGNLTYVLRKQGESVLIQANLSNWIIIGSYVGENSGTYTPTLSNTTNVTGSTAYLTGWYRTGTMITVFGKIDIDVTLAASSATELGVSLPVASNMTGEEDLGGTAISDSVASLAARIKGDATNDRAAIVFKAISLTNDSYSFEFSYQVK